MSTLALLGGDPGASAAPTPTPENAVRGDVDGDLVADLMVGMPNFSRGRDDEAAPEHHQGLFQFHYSAYDVEGITGHFVVGPDSKIGAGDRFGAAVVTVDTNEDGYSDVLVSAPGLGGGRVYVMFGSATGRSKNGSLALHPSSAESGDNFGETIAVSAHPDGGLNVWIGAPGDDIGGVENAGSVRHYRLVPTATMPEVRFLGRIHQDSPGIPGHNEPGDRFGSVLDASDQSLVIGAPLEDVRDTVDAGSVVALRYSRANNIKFAQRLSQAGDQPGKPERGDEFGSAISARLGMALVGVPQEKVGTLRDAGVVQVYETDGDGRLHPGRTLTQGSRGVAGVVEAGDRFGSAVLVGDSLLCQQSVDAAIGTPYEDFDGMWAAGTVTLLHLLGESGCSSRVLYQGNGLGGSAEPGDHTGAELTTRYARVPGESTTFEQAWVGSPGEDLFGVQSAGVVNLTPPASEPDAVGSFLVRGEPQTEAAFARWSFAEDGLGFGKVIG